MTVSKVTGSQNSIGAAASLNVATVTNTATIGAGDTISADGVTVSAQMVMGTNNQPLPNDFSTQALGVALGSQASGYAGSAGINVITINTQASIGGLTGTITSGSNQVMGISNTAKLSLGQAVSGPDIPAGTTITGIGPAPGTITLSNPVSPVSESLTATPTGSSVVGTVTNGLNMVTGISSTAVLFDGEAVTGIGIPVGTTITSIVRSTASSPGSIMLSAPATITGGPVFETITGLPSTIVGTLNGMQVTGISSTTGLNVGETVTGNGIPVGTTITAIGPASGTITLSAPATFSVTESLSGSTTVKSFGGLTVHAENDQTLQNIAVTLAVGMNTGAGAAVNVNVLNNTTSAFLASGVQANVADLTQVTSESSLNPGTDVVPSSTADQIIPNNPTTITGTLTLNSPVVTGFSSSAPLFAGEPLQGTGIVTGTVVLATGSIPFTGTPSATNPNQVTTNTVKGLAPTETVSGTGILPGTTIESIAYTLAGTVLTLSAPFTATTPQPLTAGYLILAAPAISSVTSATLTQISESSVLNTVLTTLINSVQATDLAGGVGSASGGKALAGSFIVNVINQTTDAYISSGDSINTLVGTTGYPAANSDEGLTVSATGTTNIVAWAGAAAGGKNAGIGAAVLVQRYRQ